MICTETTIRLSIESYVAEGAEKRRFQWCLSSDGEQTLSSPDSFATKREATLAGETALRRAQERGRLR